MVSFFVHKKARISYKLIAVFLLLAFIISVTLYRTKRTPAVPAIDVTQEAYASALPYMPPPATRIEASPPFESITLRGIQLDKDNPLTFHFIIDEGDKKHTEEEIKKMSQRLIKYFLATLTIPEEDLWVNLSPYEEDAVVPDELGLTEMGRDLLAQDYVLKQLLASLTYPESPLGRRFWEHVYQRAFQLYGTTNIPVNTFNKIWIVPGEAVIYEDRDKAFIGTASLKVMLEEDYLLLHDNADNPRFTMGQLKENDLQTINNFTSSITKEIILPVIENEVNYGKNFAYLRQVYHSLVLATWFKKKLKETIFERVYVDKKKIKGVDVDDATIKEKIYQQYLEAYKKGAYNYIKKDYDIFSRKNIKRQYYSGGVDWRAASSAIDELPMEFVSSSAVLPSDSGMRVSVNLSPYSAGTAGVGGGLGTGRRAGGAGASSAISNELTRHRRELNRKLEELRDRSKDISEYLLLTHELTSLFRGNKYFADFNRGVWQNIAFATGATVLTNEDLQGGVLIRQGDTVSRQEPDSHAMYLILEGSFEIINEETGQTIAFPDKGHIVGEIGPQTGYRTATVRILDESERVRVLPLSMGMYEMLEPFIADGIKNLAEKRLQNLRRLLLSRIDFRSLESKYALREFTVSPRLTRAREIVLDLVEETLKDNELANDVTYHNPLHWNGPLTFAAGVIPRITYLYNTERTHELALLGAYFHDPGYYVRAKEGEFYAAGHEDVSIEFLKEHKDELKLSSLELEGVTYTIELTKLKVGDEFQQEADSINRAIRDIRVGELSLATQDFLKEVFPSITMGIVSDLHFAHDMLFAAKVIGIGDLYPQAETDLTLNPLLWLEFILEGNPAAEPSMIKQIAASYNFFTKFVNPLRIEKLLNDEYGFGIEQFIPQEMIDSRNEFLDVVEEFNRLVGLTEANEWTQTDRERLEELIDDARYFDHLLLDDLIEDMKREIDTLIAISKNNNQDGQPSASSAIILTDSQQDAAMKIAETAMPQTPGGIDLGADNLDVAVEGEGMDIPVLDAPIDIETFRGFTFEIITIERVDDLDGLFASSHDRKLSYLP